MKRLFIILSILTICATTCSAITFQEYQSPGVPEKAMSFVYNSSGGQLTKGMVVVADAAGVKGNTIAMAVTTTTTADNSLVFGVVTQTIDTGTYGLVQVWGYCAVVNLAAGDTPYPSSSANTPWVSTGTTAGSCGATGGGNVPCSILGYLVGDTPSNQSTIPIWIKLH